MTYELYQTSRRCPEQYDVILDGAQVGYIRIRRGVISAEVPEACGTRVQVYEHKTIGDGELTQEERPQALERATKAIHAAQFSGIKVMVPKGKQGEN